MKKFATFRNFCILVGILMIAYAAYGLFSGEILVFRMKGSGSGGPKFVHDELVVWAALGWLSLAVGAFLIPGESTETLPLSPRERLSRAVGPGLLFVALGICVLMALGISIK